MSPARPSTWVPEIRHAMPWLGPSMATIRSALTIASQALRPARTRWPVHNRAVSSSATSVLSVVPAKMGEWT